MEARWTWEDCRVRGHDARRAARRNVFLTVTAAVCIFSQIGIFQIAAKGNNDRRNMLLFPFLKEKLTVDKTNTRLGGRANVLSGEAV